MKMLFWILALALSLMVAFVLTASARRAALAEASDAAESLDIQVYRDQLGEVDRDLERGLLSEEDAARIRAEVARRILAADSRRSDAKGLAAQETGTNILTLTLPAVALVLGGAALYAALGQPGYPDMPLKARLDEAQQMMAARPSQASYEAELPPAPAPQADPEFAALMEELRTTLSDRPDDLRGFRLLARNETTLGNYTAAYQAQARVIALSGEEARSEDYAQLARLMISAAQGYVSPEAESALRSALTLDAGNGFARYYYGLMFLQNGRPDRTFSIWRALLEESPPSAPWVGTVRASIEDLAWVAGVDYTLPDTAGPTAADIAAAQDLSAADQTAMIEGMVASLAERLATEGGPATEWARLISAYAVLGRPEAAAAIWQEAQAVFAESDSAMRTLRMAAEQAGLVN